MSLPTQVDAPAAAQPRWSLVIHGGAGILTRDSVSPEQETGARAGLAAALAAGSEILSAGGDALDAVQAAVQVL
ncbi:MAG: isoaspartyl peptidase/L-asparaginase, partial [Sphingomonadales bacterium]